MVDKLKTYELILNDENDGVTAVSIVDEPAMDSLFITLNKDKELILFNKDVEQHIITGAAMIPNKMIYRNSTFIKGECEVFFTAETINKASKLFLSGINVHNSTLAHLIPTDKVEIVESWIVMDKDIDKSKALGIDVPNGTWMLSYHILDEDLWKSIKDGNFNGFSIEANFEAIMFEAKKTYKYSFTKDEMELLSEYFKNKLYKYPNFK